MHPLQELEEEYFRAQHGPGISARAFLLPVTEFVGRAHAAVFVRTAHQELGGAKIYRPSAKT